MTVAIPSLAVFGETISVPTGTRNITVELPGLANDYIISAQSSMLCPVWLSGASGTQATLEFAIDADAGTTLTVVALPVGLPGLNNVVLPAGTYSYPVTTQTNQSVVPIVTWNTQVWFIRFGNTTTFFFSNAPAANANFGYLIVGPGQNTHVISQPVDANIYTATITTPDNTTFLPIAVPTWNTAVGLVSEPSSTILNFTNSSPGFANTGVLIVAVPLNVTLFPLPIPAPVPQQQPWVVTEISPEDFAQQMLSMFPYPWLSDAARSTTGIAYALFLAMGTSLNYISQQLYYAWSLCRLDTITDLAGLELFSQDYFNNNLPPQPGESVNAYRNRIQALLLQPKVTRQAIINAIEFAFPGTIVRAIEPWNPGDTGGYSVSYFDYDSPQIPSLYGDPAQRYIGYLEIQLAPIQELDFKLWGYDIGAAFGSWTGYFQLPVESIRTQVGQINLLINQITALGTQIWVKYVNGIVNPFSVGGSYDIATGLFNFNIQTPSVVGFYNLFVQLSNPITIWQTGTNITGFTVNTSAPTPSGTRINYVAVENSTIGTNRIVMNSADDTLTIHSDAVNNIVLIQPQWNTNFWYTSRSVNGINYEFSSAPGTGQFVNSLVVPVAANAGYHSVSANATSITLSVTVNMKNIPIVMPNWNTTIGVLPDFIHNTITLTFSNPAPADSTGEVMFVSYAL